MRHFLQLTLDFFSPQAPSHRPAAQVADEEPAHRAVPLSDVLAPAAFRHPRWNREALLQGSVVSYEFKRAKRRTIGFTVGPEGLVVRAPKWVTLAGVDAAVVEKADWILKKLDEARSREQRMAAQRIEWKNGATIPFLGEPITIVLDPRHDFAGVGAQLDVLDGASVGSGAERRLRIGLPPTASAEQIRDVVQAWLIRQARRVFEERLHHFAPLLRVQWRKLAISSAGTRWGSASANGAIRLNWRLIHFRVAVIDYVVAHELSHLRVMDHSPRFWEVVQSVLPEYKALRGQLKDEALPQWN